ncbi:polysaccharide deacetylase family protein [Neptunomonas antarctica]|uniref:Polysaccharide deacetylase n=1 Tax=Neptunomonas antarctica TaxID=619304 RepID=A0A1N7J0K1_9GAMM|nr:polysaccharide deacetylase family protein [Neptunomonas antarctica]SIS42912.1 Polysaccharide deacetylase [Neptunomonas antarctica]
MIMSIIAVLIAVVLLLWFLGNYNIWRPVVSSDQPRILMYHSIGDGISDLSVSTAKFDQQLKWLKAKGYRFVTVSELLELDSTVKVVALTFDDGFEDNYTNMFPVLQRYAAKATVYLAPDISGIDRLTVEQVKGMQASGLCEFGAHTLNHVNLSQLDDPQAQVEIIKSKQKVESMTESECRSFAYPFGRYTDRTVELVKAAGFDSAVTVKKGIEHIQDPYKIKRISVLGKTNIVQFQIAMTRGRYRV